MNATGGFNQSPEENSRFPAAFVAGLVVVSVVVLVIVLVSHSSRPAQPSRQPKMPFDAAAQGYAPNIQFNKLEMAESSNLLNEKFTYLNGVVSNNGSRAIEAMEVTVVFHDPFNQVILREKRRVISASGQPLGAGQEVPFQMTFEGVPAEWNRQYPTVSVTGLVLK